MYLKQDTDLSRTIANAILNVKEESYRTTQDNVILV